MRALLDTDAFCKLAVARVLHGALQRLGMEFKDCGRLPALTYMLRRGRLRKVFGDDVCDALVPVAESVPVAPRPGDLWLEKLAGIPVIDPGEAQIFAAAAEARLILLSGDKRALRALKDLPGFPRALAGRIVTLEAILIALCDQLGVDEVRNRVQALTLSDKVVSVSFSDRNPDPRAALLSYQESLVTELQPLLLWDPRHGGGT